MKVRSQRYNVQQIIEVSETQSIRQSNVRRQIIFKRQDQNHQLNIQFGQPSIPYILKITQNHIQLRQKNLKASHRVSQSADKYQPQFQNTQGEFIDGFDIFKIKKHLLSSCKNYLILLQQGDLHRNIYFLNLLKLKEDLDQKQQKFKLSEFIHQSKNKYTSYSQKAFKDLSDVIINSDFLSKIQRYSKQSFYSLQFQENQLAAYYFRLQRPYLIIKSKFNITQSGVKQNDIFFSQENAQYFTIRVKRDDQQVFITFKMNLVQKDEKSIAIDSPFNLINEPEYQIQISQQKRQVLQLQSANYSRISRYNDFSRISNYNIKHINFSIKIPHFSQIQDSIKQFQQLMCLSKFKTQINVRSNQTNIKNFQAHCSRIDNYLFSARQISTNENLAVSIKQILKKYSFKLTDFQIRSENLKQTKLNFYWENNLQKLLKQNRNKKEQEIDNMLTIFLQTIKRQKQQKKLDSKELNNKRPRKMSQGESQFNIQLQESQNFDQNSYKTPRGTQTYHKTKQYQQKTVKRQGDSFGIRKAHSRIIDKQHDTTIQNIQKQHSIMVQIPKKKQKVKNIIFNSRAADIGTTRLLNLPKLKITYSKDQEYFQIQE